MINELIVFIVVICFVIGGVIGFVYRGRTAMELATSAATSAMLFVYLQWVSGTLSTEWSMEQPLTSLVYLIGPFLCVFFLPTASMSLLAGFLWRNRSRRTKRTGE